MRTFFNRYHHYLLAGLCLLVIAISIVLSGCSTTDSDSDAKNEIVDVAIKPHQANIAVGGNVDFSIVAVTAAGDEIPVPAKFNTSWSSTNSTVFTVDGTGEATGQGKGTAYCVIEVNGQVEAKKQITISRGRLFTGRDSAFVSVP